MKFKVENMHCINCANTIKNALCDEFGEIKVNLENKIIEANISSENEQNFKDEIADLGFEAKKINE